jgi:hypothetical protein
VAFSGRSIVISIIAFAWLTGCSDSPPPRATTVPASIPDPVKPISDPNASIQPGYDDPPLVNQQLPEEPRFVQAYVAVGRPRIMIFVNHTLDGNLLPVNDAATLATIETTLTDWMSAQGQTTIISPISARQKLTEPELADLQSGHPQMIGPIAGKLQADVLVQVECRPSKQADQPLLVTMIAQALNTKSGQQLAQASVQTSLPMDNPTVSRTTRIIARKLMDEMTNTWNATAAPTTQP